jgi:DNA-directed RNA polymerase specialized sigma subunit
MISVSTKRKASTEGSETVPLIEREVIKRIERELYRYPENVKNINLKREELLHSTPRPEGETSGTNYISNPTLVKAVKLTEIAESEEAQWVELITDAMKTLPWEYQALIKLKYFEGMRNSSVAEALHISRSLYFAWRENAITYLVLMATQRGLLKPIEERKMA